MVAITPSSPKALGLLLVALVLPAVTSAQRCTVASEPARISLVETNNGYDDEYAVTGRYSDCFFHFFSKQEMLDHCTVLPSAPQNGDTPVPSRHIIYFGGSTHTGTALSVFKMMYPFDYPANAQEWINCIEPCDIFTGTGTVTYADMVVNKRTGEVVSWWSIQSDEVVGRRGGLRDTTVPILAEHFAETRTAMLEAPGLLEDGFIRLSFGKVRYFDSVFPIAKYIADQSKLDGYALDEPIVFTGVRREWYYYCWKPVSWCPRDDMLEATNEDLANSMETIQAWAKNGVETMVKDFNEQMPNSLVIVLEDQWNQWVNDYSSLAISASTVPGQFQTIGLRGETYSNGASSSRISHDGHPNNQKSFIMAQRMLNVVCPITGPAHEATGEVVQFQGKGCNADDRPDESWAYHYYQPCGFTVALATPAPTTTTPTTSPTTSEPTAYPTSNPTVEGCRNLGSVCAVDADCCTERCVDLECQPRTASPTESPTKFPTATPETAAPTFESVPIVFEVKLMEHWTNQSINTTEVFDPFHQRAEVLEEGLTYCATYPGLHWMHIVYIICGTLLVVYHYHQHFRKIHERANPDEPYSFKVLGQFLFFGCFARSKQRMQDVALSRGRGSSGRARSTSKHMSDSEEGVHTSPALEDEASKKKSFSKRTQSMVPVAAVVAAKKPNNRTLAGLGMARYIASVHIVAGHFVNKCNASEYITTWHTHQFGYTWVPWFMMLSGFVLTHARMVSKDPLKTEPVHVFLHKRIRSIYPLFVVGILSAAFINMDDGGVFSFATSRKYDVAGSITSVLLLQSWVPELSVNVVQQHCWFLSCIIIYWVVHNTMYHKLRQFRTRNLVKVTVCLLVIPWIGLAVIPPIAGVGLKWYEPASALSETMYTLFIMLKFHPVFYFHIYILGMVFALLYHRTLESPPMVFRWGAVIGYVGVWFFFAMIPVSVVSFPAHYLLMRLGGLALFQGLILVGLAVGEDPVSRLLGLPIFAPLGDLSYPQYVFQFLAFKLWYSFSGAGFWFLLLGLAVLGFHGVQAPLKNYKAPRNKQLFGLASSVALVGLVVGLYYLRAHEVERLFPGFSYKKPTASSLAKMSGNGLDGELAGTSILPETVVYSHSSRDVDLALDLMEDNANLLLNLPSLDGTYQADEYRLTNPSIVRKENAVDEYIVAFRRHRYERVAAKGNFVAEGVVDEETGAYFAGEKTAQYLRTSTWYSDIVVGVATYTRGAISPFKFKTLEVVDDLNDAAPCAPRYLYTQVNPDNVTFSQTLTTGPEDPRLYQHEDGLHFSFHSKPRTTGWCETAGRLYDFSYASKDAIELTPPVPTAADVVEKNWIHFEHPFDGHHFIYSLHPFVVMKRQPDGGMVEVTRTTDLRLARAVDVQGYEVHGGANAILVTSAPNRDPYFLATFHMVSKYDVYINYAIEFEAQAPFNIVRISRPLPLLMDVVDDDSINVNMAFGSGVVQLSDAEFAFSYGSSNRQARVLVLSDQDLEYLFDITAVPESTVPTKTPTKAPTKAPTNPPTNTPTKTPTKAPSRTPTTQPTEYPTVRPGSPTKSPTTKSPTSSPTSSPTLSPVALGERCAPNGVTFGVCEVGVCIELTNWSKCISCEPSWFDRSCNYWSAAFVEKAELACDTTCLPNE